jgi:cytochrome c5
MLLRSRQILVLASLCGACFSAGAAQSTPAPAATPAVADGTFESTVQPFLTKNCIGCHNAKLKTAAVDFSQYKTQAAADAAPELWEKAVEKLRQGAMPPQPIPHPKQDDVNAAIRWMEGSIARADANAKPDPGHITAHRLNRVEYNNTVRDLMGVDIRPADDFPQDDSGYGFDNNGDVLSMSPVLTERYLDAAGKLVQAALYGQPKMKPVVSRHQPTSRELHKEMRALADYDRTGLSMSNSLHATHRFPVDAEYEFRVALGGSRPLGSEPVEVAFWLDGKQVQTARVSAKPSDRFGTDLTGQHPEFRVHVTSGDHWVAATILHIYEGLPPSYGGPNPSKLPEPPPPTVEQLMRVKPGASPADVAEARAKAEIYLKKGKVAANATRVSYFEVVGPYNQVTGPSPRSRELLLGVANGRETMAGAHAIVARFARRAFRRPVSREELKPYLDLYARTRQSGASFDESVGAALQAILISPDFLFRIDTPPTASPNQQTTNGVFKNVSFRPAQDGEGTGDSQNVQPVGDYALASRLSYFLWSTMPDEALMRCAEQGKLHRPEVLRAQVLRMLKDPRSQALSENFAGQWLELRKLESVAPDHERFPQWDDYLRMSMQRETELFFDHLVRDDGSVLDLLDSKTTYVNQKLAEFYGIPGVKGIEFRPVSLDGTHRAGVLTQGSVLTVSSYATRTSPVLRGKWVLENFLNATIPPPPPNVPRLDESKVGEDASIRQQMEAHRANPMCAGCHSKMDPIGFSFENFNAIGQWRDKDGKFPVDASGKLPSGQKFNGALQLEQIYRQDPTVFVECVTDKLMTYALGRGIERPDRPVVKQIVKRISNDNYRFSDLVLEIVNSLPFEMSRTGDRT